MAGWTLIGYGAAAFNTPGATATATVPAGGVPKGALVVVATFEVLGTTVGSIADSRLNSYVAKAGLLDTTYNADLAAIWESYNLATALQAGDTIVYTPQAAGIDACIAAFYRLDAPTSADPFDQSAASSGTNGSPNSTATGTLALAPEGAFGIVGYHATTDISFSAGTNIAWAALQNVDLHDTFNTIYVRLQPEWADVGAQTAVTAEASLSASPTVWVAVVVTFKLTPFPPEPKGLADPIMQPTALKM